MSEKDHRCPEPCGKIRYSKDRAKLVAKRLGRDGNEDERIMMAYPAHGCWHVGHSQRASHRISKILRRRRQEQLDRYDREV